MQGSRRRHKALAGLVGVTTAIAIVIPPAGASTQVPSLALAHKVAARSQLKAADSGGGDSGDDTLTQAQQAGAERSAPGLSVPGAAYAAALSQAAALPVTPGTWSELTHQPTLGAPAGYTDPTWSNVGSGLRQVSGRMTALAADGSTIYGGGADGGVWKSTDAGTTWTPIFDQMPTLSIGALAVNPADHSLWVGTGEANTNADAYAGEGVYRSADGGKTFTAVGGSELQGHTTYRLTFDGAGNVYDATNQGLFRRSTADLTSPWTVVLKPDPNPGNNPYETSFITDVVVTPGSGGATVLAADGWRGGGNPPRDTKYNGFYLSTDHGLPGTFTEITPAGAINAKDIGRTTFAYSADGSKLYAIIEGPNRLLSGDGTVLQGIFVSANGSPTGPWTLIADAAKLCASGSQLSCPSTYEPGVQAWYNQSLVVDPANPEHVIAGLEEQYQTFDGGQTWTTISPYFAPVPACGTACPPTTHPDQHAAVISDGTLYIGNDGGLYSRPLDDTRPRGDWTDLNNTIHTLQYYDAEAGAAFGGFAEWGGLQDNGTVVLFPSKKNNIEPAGGDGGYVIVDPTSAQRAVGEYVDMTQYLTTDGGHTFTTISPSCLNAAGPAIPGCDPAPRFIAPMATDVHNPGHWVAGGEYVWDDTAAWSTVCNPTTCNWTNVHDTGAGHSITALAVSGKVTYAGWCGNCNPGSSTPFADGIDTNYGGSWHTITAPNLPRRYIAGLTVDPANPAHVYAVYNGFSRRWIPSAGVGHVYESTDGGSTWTDISGALPDVPADALVIAKGHLVLGTDIGMFTALAGQSGATSWSRFGTGLPNTSINDLRLDPDGTALLAATHGRGLWAATMP